MENNRTIKLLIIFAVVCLIVLLLIYFVIRIQRQQVTSVATTITTPTQTPYVFPSSTPYPSPQIQISLSAEDMKNYSPLDQKTLDMRDEYEATNNPDLIVKNNTPFDNEYFMVVPVPVETSTGGYYKITVYPLNEDKALVETKFKEWLRSIRLSDEAIAKLKIEYQEAKLPSANIDL